MIRIVLISYLLTTTGVTIAQTIYAGENVVDKVKTPGLYLTIQGDGKQIEKDWESQLQTFGRVSASRGTYRVTNANIPAISSEPINMVSTVKSSRKDATLFASFDLGNGNFVTTGGTGYSAAESMLKTFADNTLYNQEVRTAQVNFDEAQQSHQKLVKNGERLQRNIDQNAKDKEKLLKRLEENANELVQLQKDTETNKADQEKALSELETRKSNVEAVKAKRSN